MTQGKEARPEVQVDRFRELLEAAPDSIIEVDGEGRIALLNSVTEKMFGYSRGELLGNRSRFWSQRTFALSTKSIVPAIAIARSRVRWEAA